MHPLRLTGKDRVVANCDRVHASESIDSHHYTVMTSNTSIVVESIKVLDQCTEPDIFHYTNMIHKKIDERRSIGISAGVVYLESYVDKLLRGLGGQRGLGGTPIDPCNSRENQSQPASPTSENQSQPASPTSENQSQPASPTSENQSQPASPTVLLLSVTKFQYIELTPHRCIVQMDMHRWTKRPKTVYQSIRIMLYSVYRQWRLTTDALTVLIKLTNPRQERAFRPMGFVPYNADDRSPRMVLDWSLYKKLPQHPATVDYC